MIGYLRPFLIASLSALAVACPAAADAGNQPPEPGYSPGNGGQGTCASYYARHPEDTGQGNLGQYVSTANVQPPDGVGVLSGACEQPPGHARLDQPAP